MRTFKTMNHPARLTSAVLAVLASTLLLGGQLSLFDRVSTDASVALAKTRTAAPLPVFAEREAKRPRRS